MRNFLLPLLFLAVGLFTTRALKSQDPVIYSVMDNSSPSQYIAKYDVLTQITDTVFNLPSHSVIDFAGSGGCSIDIYNKRYFFTNGVTDSLFFYDINNAQMAVASLGFPNHTNYVCGSLQYDQFMNSLIWMTNTNLQIYNIAGDTLSTYPISSIGENGPCSGQATAYNFMQQQLFCMSLHGPASDTLYWLLIDVTSQQVLVNQIMPDSLNFNWIVYSPISGKYYGWRDGSNNISDIFEIDPINLSASKLGSVPGSPGTGQFVFNGMFNAANNSFLMPYESSTLDSTNLAVFNLNNNTYQMIPFAGFPGPDRSQLLSEPHAANLIYKNGKLTATTGLSYKWYLNGNLIQTTSINNIIPAQSGYYKADVITQTNTYVTDSINVNLTGINEVAEPYVQILPNPASDYIIIHSSNFDPQLISIYDLSGSKIVEKNYAPEMDISGLAGGVYFIEIKNEYTTQRKMFVKVK